MLYMKIEGIDGNVTTEGHEKWLELGSLQWGVGRAVSMSTGAGHERETSAPSISEISVTKTMDKASPKLFQEACSGKAKKVQIHLVRTANDKLQTYMEYELENCLISGYSVSSGGDLPSESLSLAFTKITMKFTHWDKGNKPGTPIAASYDLETAKKG
ncbi:MAG: type VI secretion system tube protein Hcp [Gammaproteobacteria bacterium]|jgi:type VI secretion system secreted protein Hcp